MTVKVIALRSSTGWELLKNPQKLFPKAGEVEVRSFNPSEYHQNDWVSFQVAHKEARGKWRASTYRNLMPFLDLKETGGLDELRKLLTEDGVDSSPHVGTSVIRYCEHRIITLNLTRSEDNRYRMVSDGSFYIYPYDPECLNTIPTDAGMVFLYELRKGSECIEELDWSPDEGYIKRIVRAMAGAHDPDAEAVIGWLKRHADVTTGQVGASPEDTLAARQAARSGELAKRLLAERDLLRELNDSLLSDARVLSYLEKETQAIAELERETIRASLFNELEQEIKFLREGRLLEISAELEALETARREALKDQLEQDTKTNVIAIEELVTARQSEMEAELELRRIELERGIDELASQHRVLIEQRDTIKSQIKTDSQYIAELQVKETQAISEIKKLKEDAASIQVPKSIQLESVLRFNPPQTVPVHSIEDMQQAIENCILLTPKGKERMTQFLVLILAGETPVLLGSEAQDFLLIAEGLFSSGRSVRLEADPTIITFEDLWLRAGTQLPTSLTHGLEIASRNEPTTILAVIERAERSGARFWLPSLADRIRRGELPRRFFICATIEDENCEEAQVIRSQTAWLQLFGTIAPTAPALVPIALAPSNMRQLDPGDRPLDLLPAMAIIAPLAHQLTLVNGLRLARVAIEWVRLNQGAQYEEIPSEFAEFFINSPVQNGHA
nr:hypothetical protein [Halomonas sp.]